MKEQCVINGERCSTCCKVIILPSSKNVRDWISHYRRTDEESGSGDGILKLVRRISKRRAKKINPYLVKTVGSDRRFGYYLCRNYTGSGCADYENRPYTCSGYPRYGMTEEQWSNRDLPDPEYRIECTYYD